jgi:hypothetical protein
MKQLFFISALCLCFLSGFNQVKISALPTTTADPTGGTVPIVLSGTTYGINPALFGASTPALDYQAAIYKAFGSPIKAESVGAFSASSNITLTSEQILWVAIWLTTPSTLTGVGWVQTTNGSGTATNFNGVALYTVSGTTLTQVAVSANTSTTWTQGTGFQKLPFTSTYSAAPGPYVVAILYSASSGTVPVISAIVPNSNAMSTMGMTSGIKISGFLSTQTVFPSPTESFSSISSNGSFLPWVALY